MTSFLQDLRYGLRTLSKSRGFSIVAICTIALGIGATTAMFTVLDGVVLKPLQYADADRIVALNTKFTDRGRSIPRITGGDYVDLRQQREIFSAIATYAGGEMGVQVAGRAEFVGTMLTSTGFMNVFGATPLAGRIFNADDAERSAIVSAAFATRNFGSVAAAVGKSFRMEDHTYSIVGVVPATFRYPERTEVWLAAARDPQNVDRTAYNYRAVAKLRDGVSLDVANARLATFGDQLAQAYPDSNKNKSFAVRALQEQLVAPVRSTLLILMGAVGLVLLIACANVANLMLARSTERSREMAVRAALGASRGAIVRQSLAESLLLAVTGGALGVLLAIWTTRLVVFELGQRLALPRLGDIIVDARVLLFAIALCFIASVGFGLAPALQASRVNLSDALKHAGTRGVQGGQPARLRNVLVVAQIALSFVLVISAGLLFRSFLSLLSVDLGFRTESTLVMYAHAPAKTAGDYTRVVQFEEELFDRIRQLPGVTSVAGAMGLPTGDYGSNGGYVVEGQGSMTENRPAKLPQANFSLSGPAYFSTMGIPLLRGRDFTAADRDGSEPVVIISQALAKQSFPDRDPIGQRIQCGLDEATMRWMRIVGVVGDVRQDSPASDAAAAMYMPLAQHPFRANEVQVAIRTQLDPLSLVKPVQDVVRSMNPDVATKFTTMDTMVHESVAAPRFRTALAMTFAILALVLAAMGVYAVMSYVTVQRTGEFAVRAALGASPSAILKLVLAGAGKLALTGVAMGLLLTLISSRVLESLLFGLKSSDGLTYVVVCAVVVPAVLLAAFLPALRASRVDPLEALREQ